MGGITLPISKVLVLVVEPCLNDAASVYLFKIWVLLYDVPAVLRRVALLLEATKMIGRPRMVDESSLASEGPVRMLFHSHHPAGTPDFVLLFANM
jgi:hypothetical protein